MRAAYERITTGERSFNAYVRADDHFPFNWHYHPEYELTLILDSHGQRMVGDSVEDYGSGDLILLGENLPHTWRSNPATTPASHRAMVVQFRGNFLGEDFFEAPEMRSIAALLRRSSRGLSFTATNVGQEVGAELASFVDLAPSRQLLCLLGLLERLAREPHARVLCTGGFDMNLQRVDESRIDRVCDYVAKHFDSPISQAHVAQLAGMHPAAFCRFFKRVTGRTFITYVNEVRISTACRSLIESNDSIAAISYRVGYSSQAHFTRQFRLFKNISPGQFRKRFTEPPAVSRR